MSDQRRVPMRGDSFVGVGDIEASVDASPSFRTGREFRMAIDEELLAKIGGRALEAASVRLGESVAYNHRSEIEQVVHSYVLNREWAEPIIREAIRDAVRAVVESMLTPDPEATP